MIEYQYSNAQTITLLTLKNAAALLNVSTKWFQRHNKPNDPYYIYRIPIGNKLYIDQVDILKLINRQTRHNPKKQAHNVKT